MVQFTAAIKQFNDKGEKTGWSFIEVPANVAQELNPVNKKAFRVKGKLDNYPIKFVTVFPVGGGGYIIAINAAMRKGTAKKKGAMLKVQLEIDKTVYRQNTDFLTCLADDPVAEEFFNSLTKSHQNYFSKWIDSAKTEPTRIKRIAMAVNALSRRMDFGLMLRTNRKEN
jgi:hypothetical protein